MREKVHNTKRMAVFCIVLTVAAAAVVGYILFYGPEADRSGDEMLSETTPSEAAKPYRPETAQESPAVDYNRMETDSEYRELMQKRKENFGVDKSMDLIVKSDEEIRIGDSVIPMREILEKIRLKKEGGVVEKDISREPAFLSEADRKKVLAAKLDQIRARAEAVDRILQKPDVRADHARYQRLISEYGALESLAEDYDRYLSIGKEIRRQENLMAVDPETALSELKQESAQLELEMEGYIKALADMFPDRFEPPMDPAMEPAERKRFLRSMEHLEEDLARVEKKLRDPESPASPETFDVWIDERRRLKEAVDTLKRYRDAERKLDDRVDVLAEGTRGLTKRLAGKLTDLRIQKDILENELSLRAMPVDMQSVYGIYVVQPGDNVWNIHFDFLKEYFEKKDITLYSRADEPLVNGISSGVGKILKFSETMVFIYNVREKKLGVNLDLIHPLSKIVVFNLGKAFSLLDRIDYSNISKIRFDGETLWLPAEE